MDDKENTKGNIFLRILGAKFSLPILLLIVILLILAGGVVYAIYRYPQVLGLSKGPAQVQAEVDALVKEVGALIELPKDERPTVATVTDVERVREQAFFKNAKNGDKVLIYTNSRKAILYRPTEKRIIEVGAVNINQQPESSTPPEEQSPEPSPEPSPSPNPEASPSPAPQP